MSPLVVLASQVFPSILDVIIGARSKAVETAVESAVAQVTGSNSAQEVDAKLKADPELATKLRIELARIASDERKQILDAQIAQLTLNLNAEADKRKTELNQRDKDLQNTGGARQMLGDLIQNRSSVAYVPALLSVIVTVGFFAILGIFVFMKSSLETPIIPEFPPAMQPLVKTLNADQISALVSPRSDFIIQIINICIGSLTAAFATVISYWLGSSQSSRNKDALAANKEDATIVKDMIETNTAATTNTQAPQRGTTSVTVTAPPAFQPELGLGVETTVGAMTNAGSTAAGRADAAASSAGPDMTEPVKPAPPEIIAEVLPELTRSHKHFANGVSWALTTSGIAIDGARAQGTVGDPSTVRKIWDNFGAHCAAAAKQYGVPVELIVATIATESSGNPSARRAEPRIHDESVGLMQTLVKTAQFATGRKTLRGDDLLDPRTSIEAGTAYIASQRGTTHFDAPLVAAAYNAGSLQLDDANANRWKLRCFPLGTGAHIDRFVSWFSDAMRVSDDDDWSAASGCPSYAAILGVEGPRSETVDISSPDFPPRPSFKALVSVEEKQALFGKFNFAAQPVAGNPENIRILGDWEKNNIVNVSIPLKTFLGKAGPLQIRFHKLAADQLKALWLEWESANLLDRILTYDGGFVPRFQRKSTTKLSNHAWGTAFDINAAFNPLAAEPALMDQKGCVRELVSIANKHGFFWGGHFLTREDGMHFEVAKIV
jgi:soluble lytic murein transglycosylase-like protein